MKHNIYFDFIKGLAIVGVVAIHTISLDFDPMSVTGLLVIVIRNILGCCVPLFIAASGYFLWKKHFDTKTEYKQFLISRLRIVYVPMLLWGVPWFLLLLKGVNMLGVVYVTIMYLIGGLSIFYFITLILECYVVLPFVRYIKSTGIILLSMASIIITLGWTIVNHITVLNLPLVIYCSLPTYIGYFALGCYLGRTKIEPKSWLSWTITIVGLVLSVVETYYWFEYHGENNGLGLKPSVSLFSFGAIMLMFSNSFSAKYHSTNLTRWLEWCGAFYAYISVSHARPIYIEYTRCTPYNLVYKLVAIVLFGRLTDLYNVYVAT